jgi:hypothetical protein
MGRESTTEPADPVGASRLELAVELRFSGPLRMPHSPRKIVRNALQGLVSRAEGAGVAPENGDGGYTVSIKVRHGKLESSWYALGGEGQGGSEYVNLYDDGEDTPEEAGDEGAE